ncbi:MAG: 2-oxo acid dehydrogenase subunit E2 [Cytophagales bacterium]|nr:MAG: 2-oxo acid dehydrogenase subunit E2 [Cytophagales bacterium]
MSAVQMLMPKMGESVMEGTILKWLKKVGEPIAQDEPVLEVATDKVDTEIPATHAGILQEILVAEGQVVQVGQPIALIAAEGSSAATTPVETPVVVEQTSVASSVNVSQAQQQSHSNGANRFYSPLVLSIAKEEQISMEELATVAGTGSENRVTKKDILAYVAQRKNNVATTVPVQNNNNNAVVQKQEIQPVVTASVAPAQSYGGNVEIVEMDRMRKMIAQRMVESKHTSPHVTTFVEVDVTNIVLWRNKIKDAFKKREGENITFTPVFIEAIAKALKDFPMVNISVDGDKIIVKKDINIGMAAALPTGNLIVPVIKNADRLNLLGLTKTVNDLANRARNNKLSPDELNGGTYSMSNIGSFGNEMGTPIIMQPQVAILAFGAIKKKPAVIETETGDMIAIRHMMFISHSYDHRVIDGALGGMFARRVADYLEAFDVNRSL